MRASDVQMTGRDTRPNVWEQPAGAPRADRAAVNIPFENPEAVALLLASLREAARRQVTALAERLPGEGMFQLFREQESRQDRFRFGRRLRAARPNHGAGNIWTDAAGFSRT